MDNITPVINIEELKQKADEFAQKGAISVLEDFYNGYNSPYRKALEEELKSKGFSNSFELPDVVARMNEFINIEIDKIANTAISKTFIPLVSKFLTRAEPEIKLSEILKEFINICDFDPTEEEIEDYQIEVYDRYEDCNILRGSFLNVKISNSNNEYDLHLSRVDKHKKDIEKEEWEVISLPTKPHNSNVHQKTMKLSFDGGATLEMPFTTSVLQDQFSSFIARLVMAKTKITLDVEYFDEDMFPENDGCHC